MMYVPGLDARLEFSIYNCIKITSLGYHTEFRNAGLGPGRRRPTKYVWARNAMHIHVQNMRNAKPFAN